MLEWFDLDTFDLDQYEYFDTIEHGDLNVIVPNKFAAFSGPAAEHIQAYDGAITLGPGSVSQLSADSPHVLRGLCSNL